jgi:hypothetical protein
MPQQLKGKQTSKENNTAHHKNETNKRKKQQNKKQQTKQNATTTKGQKSKIKAKHTHAYHMFDIA